MTGWTEEELGRIEARELQLASFRRDGTLRPYVTMWVVRANDELYVRSAYGPNNPWFRRAKASGAGRIRAGGLERDVSFAEPVPGVHGGVDAAGVSWRPTCAWPSSPPRAAIPRRLRVCDTPNGMSQR
ncbi:MAG TPA: DUF2255 family protein [Actinomycetota bacterium]|nr:DUF2255 family protein [Actinomycetota bacterium]